MSDAGKRGGNRGNGAGNGAGEEPAAGPSGVAGVVPFPADGETREARREAAARRRARNGSVPGPEAGAIGEPDPGEAPTLAEQVQALATQGLAEAEIRAVLSLPERLDAAAERELAEAFAHGQLLGRAQIKQAQFQAALRGRVTAQAQVLARLGEPRGEEGGESEEGNVGPDDLPPQGPEH